MKKVSDGKDVWGHAAFGTALPDFMSGYDDSQREKIAQAALDQDLLSSSHGDLVFGGGNLTKIQDIAKQIKEGSYTETKTPAQRLAEELAFKKSIGIV